MTIAFSRNNPWRTFLVLTTLILLMAGGAGQLQLTTDFRTYFSADNPQLQAFEKLEADFNKQDSLIFLLQSNDADSVFTASRLAAVEQLTEASWRLPYARRVDSLSNYQRIESDQDDIFVRDLYGADEEHSLQDITGFAQSHPQIAGRLLSQDGRLTQVVVNLSLPANDPQATAELVSAARKLVEQSDLDDFDVKLLGTAVINVALAEAVERDMAALIPGSYLLIFTALFLLTRSLAGSVLSLTLTLLSVAAVFGVLGWSGATLTPVVGAVPSMIMIIVVADCLHILVSYQHALREGLDKSAALAKAQALNIKPVMITSVTTALGLLCLNFSESPPYRDLGNLVAMAALLAGVLSLTWFVALLQLLPAPPAARADSGLGQLLLNFYRTVIAPAPKRTFAIAVIATIGIGAGLFKLQFNEQWYHYYDESFAVRQALEVQENELYGVNFIQYSVAAKQGGSVYTPDYMTQLQQLVNWLEQQPNVGYVDSLHRQLLEISQKLHADKPEFYRVPDSADEIAQSMLLYEMSLPFGMGLEERINIDKTATRLTLNLHKHTSRELVALDEKIRVWAVENTPALNLTPGTGLDMVFAQISDRNSISLFLGTLMALILISLSMMWFLSSLRLGALSLIPNMLPALLAYGAWGYVSGQVDLGLSIVACMSLGLVVDDSVHFLTKYRYAREQGNTPEQAVEFAFATVGVAMLITTVVLAAGFALLVLSPFSPTWGMGALMSLTVILAFVADIILLPLLLLLFDREKVPVNRTKDSDAVISD
ncbi:MAG: MMPL family transporter [Saccharospirillaceae bacterium]|nr:MMPL family transporter [Saccharospirillaceae bacterium]